MLITLAIVAVVALLMFGYKRLPELGRRAGQGINELAETARGAIDERIDGAESERSRSAAASDKTPVRSGVER